MLRHAGSLDQGTGSRQLVLAEIMRRPGISRTQIAHKVGLNGASVSRITRELIEAGLISETNLFGPKDRPGRKFVGLKPRGEGGFVIGIGMNAFRQSVTLANIENAKIAEWVSPTTPGKDGAQFVRTCLVKARQMVAEHVPDRARVFGVGIAVAANLDKANELILNAPTFGWPDEIDVGALVREILDIPLVLDVPSSAITKSESFFGMARGASILATLHCSLGFGIAMQLQRDDNDIPRTIGRVLNQSKVPGGTLLPKICGGLAVLNELHDPSYIAGLSDHEQGLLLAEAIEKAAHDPHMQSLIQQMGIRTAQQTSLVFDLIQPQMILLAGPMTRAPSFVDGFTSGLLESQSPSWPAPNIQVTILTPTGASRAISLAENFAMGNFDLEQLKGEVAA